jgi:long-chain fatty acid transport protein
MFMKTRLLILVLFLSAGNLFATHGTRMVGFNAMSIGRGGAGLATFDNTSLMMTNPAGLSFLGSTAIEGDFSLMVPGLHFTNTLNDAEGATNYFPVAMLAYADAPKDRDWSWGIGAFTQGGMGADFSLEHSLFRNQDGSYNLQTYHSKLAIMQGGPSFSYKLSPEFSAGVSLHLAYGMMEFGMPFSLPPSMMQGVVNPGTGMTFGDMFAAPPAQGGFGYAEVTAAAAMNNLKGFGFCGKIGFAWEISPDVSIGLAYTSPLTLSFKNGTAAMDMTAQMNDAFGKAVAGYMAQNPSSTAQQAQAAVMQQFSQMGIDLAEGVVAQYNLEAKLKFPQSLGAGVSFAMTHDLRIAADVEWIDWKDAFDNMSLSFSGGSNTNINTMLGNSGTFSLDFPMQWTNQVAVRTGIEYLLNTDLTLRAGYAFGNSPVPETTVFPVFPAVVENHVMAGASYRITPSFTIHGAVEFALKKSEAASSQSILAQEYNNSTSSLSENIFHISATLVP